MKKIVATFLVVCLSLSLLGMATASGNTDEKTDVEKQVSEYVEQWFLTNFSEHYDLSDYVSKINNFKLEDDSVYAEINAGAITTLKYDSVESLPYMEGIKDDLKINSLAEVVPAEYVSGLSKAAATELQKSVAYAKALDTKEALSCLSLDKDEKSSILTIEMAASNIINNIDTSITEVQAENLSMLIADKYVDAAECIGVGTVLTMDLIFEASYEKGEFSQISLVETHDEDTTEEASLLIPLTSDEMVVQATADINDYLNSEASRTSTVGTKGLSTYDRVDARDYAWEHTYPGYGVNTSNPNLDGWTAQYDCGHNLNPHVYVDRDYWNDDDYSIDTCLAWGHCHNDCACFVSQCLVEGGIPMSDDWEYPTDGDPTYDWHNTGGLKTYMTDEGYWDESTYSACNAGNVVYTSSGHVTLCTLNDTVTRRYTAHTNDRNNKIYYSVYECFTINTDQQVVGNV